MTSEQMSSPFTHPAFQDPHTQIRLLDLHPGAWDAPLVGSLHIYGKGKLPQYEAISYTWGDFSRLHSIEVNGQSLLIQPNCHYALSQVRLADRHRLLWIDYICINQEDVNEKGHQVQRMADIFRQANGVLASLGPEADESDLLVDNAYSLYSACERAKSDDVVKEKRVPGGSNSPAYRYLPRSIQETAYAWVERLEDSELRITFKAFVRFSSRPYWERLWVLPELHVASSVMFHCGSKVLDRKALEVLRDVFQDLRNNINFEYRAATHDFGDVQKLGVHCLPLARITSLACAWPGRRPRPFDRALVDLYRLRCSDIRDRIYALLSAYKWPDELPRLVVDYKRTRLELACEAIKCCSSFKYVTHLLKALQIDAKGLEETQHGTDTTQLLNTINKSQTEDIGRNINTSTCDHQAVRKFFPIRFNGCIVGSLSRIPKVELQTSDEILFEEEPPIDNDDNSNIGPEFVRVVLNADTRWSQELIVLIPSGAMPGDILIKDSSITPFSSFHGLVVRATRTVVYKIIGSACTRSDYQIGSRYYNGVWKPIKTFVFQDAGDSPANIRLRVRDAIALGRQIIEAEEQALVLQAQRQPPNSPISYENFNSCAIERIAHINAIGLPCSACGRFFGATNVVSL